VASRSGPRSRDYDSEQPHAPQKRASGGYSRLQRSQRMVADRCRRLQVAHMRPGVLSATPHVSQCSASRRGTGLGGIGGALVNTV
jgi:hypothetical protein